MLRVFDECILLESQRGKYFSQKFHLCVKKYKSLKIMVIFKGNTFEKKSHLLAPSVTFDPKKSNHLFFWWFWMVTIFFHLKSGLFQNPYYFRIIEMRISFLLESKNSNKHNLSAIEA